MRASDASASKPILIALLTSSVLLLAFMILPVSADAGTSYHSTPFVHGQKYNMTVLTNAASLNFTNGVDITGLGNDSWVGFTAAGSGSGYANVTICKTAGAFPVGQVLPQKVEIYMNSSGTFNPVAVSSYGFINDTATNIPKCFWVYFTFHFSTDQVFMNLSLAVSVQAPVFTSVLPILAISTLLVAQFAISRKRRQQPL